jgi:hypothetical protein
MTATMIEILAQTDPIPAWLGGKRHWTRVYGRTSGHDRATLVYEPDGDANAAICVTVGGTQGCSIGGLNGVVAAAWQDDAALPVLPGLRARHPRLRAVRYRPGKRCTLKLEGDRPFFIKCVADDRGAQFNADARMLEDASRQGFLDFAVARPAGWLPGMRIVAQHMVEGTPVVPRLWQDEALAARMGSANASLAAAPLLPTSRFDYAQQMVRTAKYARRLEKRVAGASVLLGALMDRLATVDPGLADRPIHGAPHAHQWLDGPRGLALVDFDRFSLGDPELDVATFVAEADFEEAVGARRTAEAYSSSFASRWPIKPELVRAYRVHKHVAKALRVANAIRPDAEHRALTILADARELLA